ncbi:phosphoribosyltransferase [Peptococcaceae bacterium]|nr:phosphoribosyltransferase [Peptococcaceae bacterium]
MHKYKNRVEAAKALSDILKSDEYENGIVIGVPRGGVVLAKHIADALNLPFDIIITRKIGDPSNPEVAVGSVTQNGNLMLNYEIMSRLGLTEEDIKENIKKALREVKERVKKYRGDKPLPNLKGKEVIICDDGIATGYTIKAAIKSIKCENPKKIILAVPVAPPDALKELERYVDKIVCPLVPEFFVAVSQFYKNFRQIEDEEVIELLENNS